MSASFFKGLQADNTKPYWSAHKAFFETSVRELMAALLDELSGEFGPGPIARPRRDGRFRAGRSPYKTAACSASCGRVDGRLDVHHRLPSVASRAFGYRGAGWPAADHVLADGALVGRPRARVSRAGIRRGRGRGCGVRPASAGADRRAHQQAGQRAGAGRGRGQRAVAPEAAAAPAGLCQAGVAATAIGGVRPGTRG